MSVKNEFKQALEAVEQILDNQPREPREVRESIKKLVAAYQAKDVVHAAFERFSDSGVMQWKTFLRAANVQKGEMIDTYSSRIRVNLDAMRSFDEKHLRSSSISP